MDLTTALNISARGMDVEATRLRVVAENMANQDTTANTPGGAPYRRKTITFENKMDKALGAETVRVKQIGRDQSAFTKRFDPSNPAADAQGYVQMPNVDPFVELMDMRDAEHIYATNLAVLQTTRTMLQRVINLLQ
jgi:flagellar basal-body rod protein FlgC